MCKELEGLKINISSGIKIKITNFINLILMVEISAKNKNAFDIANEVVNDSGIIKTYSSLTSIEDQAKIQNIEEMLNGIKDFVEIQREVPESTGSISEFLEDEATMAKISALTEVRDSHNASSERIRIPYCLYSRFRRKPFS